MKDDTCAHVAPHEARWGLLPHPRNPPLRCHWMCGYSDGLQAVKNLLHSEGASARFAPLDGNHADMRKRVEVFYAGRVQGVGFRYSTREIAKGFEVSGHVQNLDDGRVELVAEGEEEEIRQFLQAIRESQLGDHIRTAAESWKTTTDNCKGFVIAH